MRSVRIEETIRSRVRRPSDSETATVIMSTAHAEAAVAAAAAASQISGSWVDALPLIAWKVTTARQPPSANSAALNASRTAGRRRITSAHARPTVYAITTVQPPE